MSTWRHLRVECKVSFRGGGLWIFASDNQMCNELNWPWAYSATLWFCLPPPWRFFKMKDWTAPWLPLFSLPLPLCVLLSVKTEALNGVGLGPCLVPALFGMLYKLWQEAALEAMLCILGIACSRFIATWSCTALQLVSNNVLVALQRAVYYSVLPHLPCDLELAGLAALYT